MSLRPETDVSMSVAAPEFIWDTHEHTEVHGFVSEPILEKLQHHKARTVLDLGCGNGSLSALIARKGFSVTGLDHSQSGIDLAKKVHPEAAFGRHDLSEPLPSMHAGRYDAVLAVEVIEHLLLPRLLIANAMYALRPGGLLIVTTPFHGYWKNLALALTNRMDAHWHPLRDYGHVKFFSRATLLQLLGEQGFRATTFSTVGRVPAFARSMIATGLRPS